MIKDTRDPTKVTGKEDSQDGKREDQESGRAGARGGAGQVGAPQGALTLYKY